MYSSLVFFKAESSALLGRWGLLSNLPNTEPAQNTTASSSSSSPRDRSSSHKAKRTRTNSESGVIQDIGCEKESGDGFSAASSSNGVRIDRFHSALYGAELDPVGFSFFLSANLPVSNEQLQSLLAAGDVTERLR